MPVKIFFIPNSTDGNWKKDLYADNPKYGESPCIFFDYTNKKWYVYGARVCPDGQPKEISYDNSEVQAANFFPANLTQCVPCNYDDMCLKLAQIEAKSKKLYAQNGTLEVYVKHALELGDTTDTYNRFSNILLAIDAGLKDSDVFFQKSAGLRVGDSGKRGNVKYYQKSAESSPYIVFDIATDNRGNANSDKIQSGSIFNFIKATDDKFAEFTNSAPVVNCFIPIVTSYNNPVSDDLGVHYRGVHLTLILNTKGPGYVAKTATLIDSRGYIIGGFIPDGVKEEISSVFPECKFNYVYTGHQPVTNDRDCGRYTTSYGIKLGNGVKPENLENEKYSTKPACAFASICAPYSNLGGRRKELGGVRQYQPPTVIYIALNYMWSGIKISAQIVFFPLTLGIWGIHSVISSRMKMRAATGIDTVGGIGNINISDVVGAVRAPIPVSVIATASQQPAQALPESSSLGNY